MIIYQIKLLIKLKIKYILKLRILIRIWNLKIKISESQSGFDGSQILLSGS